MEIAVLCAKRGSSGRLAFTTSAVSQKHILSSLENRFSQHVSLFIVVYRYPQEVPLRTTVSLIIRGATDLKSSHK
ncbi:hypothetical protein PUN28_005819 [Cardiocondyla obscurior]|uniref:Uncharacterized protein n=1 Tax=Cardiocondyla obscurior TaxID=286306 RepID=A0AAW2G5N2_9HYME